MCVCVCVCVCVLRLTQLYNTVLLFYYWLQVSATGGHHQTDIYKQKT